MAAHDVLADAEKQKNYRNLSGLSPGFKYPEIRPNCLISIQNLPQLSRLPPVPGGVSVHIGSIVLPVLLPNVMPLSLR